MTFNAMYPAKPGKSAGVDAQARAYRNGRLHVGNRYVWVDYHTHCGPSFSYDANGEKPYDPVDENDPVWPAFGAWLARFNV